MDTMLREGIMRKKVINIRDIQQHPDPKTVFEALGALSLEKDNYFSGYVPILINGDTYMIYQGGFKHGEKELTKAILNGYPIDT